MPRLRQSSTDTQQQSTPDGACRLDVWLYRTRLQKTRTGAAKLILGGKVRLTRNGRTERTRKPHTLIRPGDGVTFMRGQELLSVTMIDPGTRRGPAVEAQALYQHQDDTQLSQ